MIASETVQPELAEERYPQSQLRSPFANPLVIKSNNLVSDSVTVEHRLYDAGISRLTYRKGNQLQGSGLIQSPDAQPWQQGEHWYSGPISLSPCGQHFSVNADGSLWATGHGVWLDENDGWWAYIAYDDKAEVFGLGEKTGTLNKRGIRWENWNSDVFAPHTPDITALYQSIPLLLIREGNQWRGIYMDCPARSWVDLRDDHSDILLQTANGALDLYFIPGPDLASVVQAYLSLTGKPYLPPKWALGYHQSRHSYDSVDEVQQVLAGFQAHDIPVDALYLDIRYMDEYRVFTFEPTRYKEADALIKSMSEQQVDCVPIVDPGIKLDDNYEIYNTFIADNSLVRDNKDKVYSGRVWPGDSVFPDFFQTKAQERWQECHQFYTDRGIRGIWNDMNEPSVFNDSLCMDEDARHWVESETRTHAEVHNLYGYHMSAATFDGLAEQTKERPFVLTRAGYAGIQSKATVWTGDNRSFWEHLRLTIPMCINLSLSGVVHCGPDIGGFMNDSSGELMTRWMQLGAFLPFFRNHCAISMRAQEPWSFGEPYTSAIRKAIRLRYELLPMIYGLSYQAHTESTPIMRPMFWEFAEDEQCRLIEDQFMLGNSLLVAPILSPSKTHRAVYLPEGEVWYDHFSGKKVASGWQLVSANLDELPLFVREGSVLALSKQSGNSKQQNPFELELHHFGAEISRETVLYLDDGVSLELQDDLELRITPEGLKASDKVKDQLQVTWVKR